MGRRYMMETETLSVEEALKLDHGPDFVDLYRLEAKVFFEPDPVPEGADIKNLTIHGWWDIIGWLSWLWGSLCLWLLQKSDHLSKKEGRYYTEVSAIPHRPSHEMYDLHEPTGLSMRPTVDTEPTEDSLDVQTKEIKVDPLRFRQTVNATTVDMCAFALPRGFVGWSLRLRPFYHDSVFGDEQFAEFVVEDAMRAIGERVDLQLQHVDTEDIEHEIASHLRAEWKMELDWAQRLKSTNWYWTCLEAIIVGN